MEKILKIEEMHVRNSGYSGSSGYGITTNKQVIKLLISNDQQCCESWGYLMSEDDLNEFVGAEILDIKITDTALNTASLIENGIYLNDRRFEGNVLFVTIDTNRGPLQFVAYNEHNGYYGHEVNIISQQLNYSDTL